MCANLQPAPAPRRSSFMATTVNVWIRLAASIRRRSARKKFLYRVMNEINTRLQPPASEEGSWSFQSELKNQLKKAGLIHDMTEEGEVKELNSHRNVCQLSMTGLEDLERPGSSDRSNTIATFMRDLHAHKTLRPEIAEAIVDKFIKASKQTPLVDVILAHGGQARVIGALSGDFEALQYLVATVNAPSPSNILIFNGRYFSPNTQGLNVLLSIFLLKIAFPNDVHVLRGATEDASFFSSTACAFRTECNRISKTMFRMVSKSFCYMPFAALAHPIRDLDNSQIEREQSSIKIAHEKNTPLTNVEDYQTNFRFPTLVVPGAIPALHNGTKHVFDINQIRNLSMTDETIYTVDASGFSTLNNEKRVAAESDFRVDLMSGYVVSEEEILKLRNVYSMISGRFSTVHADPNYVKIAQSSRSYNNMREMSSCTVYSAQSLLDIITSNNLRQIVTSNILFPPKDIILHSQTNLQVDNLDNLRSVLSCSAATRYADETCLAAYIGIGWKGTADFVRYGPENVKNPDLKKVSLDSRRFLESKIVNKLQTLFVMRRMELLDQFKEEEKLVNRYDPGFITLEAWARAIQTVLDFWFHTCDAPIDSQKPEDIQTFGKTFLQELLIDHKFLMVKQVPLKLGHVKVVNYHEFLASFSPFAKAQKTSTAGYTIGAEAHLPHRLNFPDDWDEQLNSLSTLLALCAKSSEQMFNFLDFNGSGELRLDEFAKGLMCIIKAMDAWDDVITKDRQLYNSLMNQPNNSGKPVWPMALKLRPSGKNAMQIPPAPPSEPSPYSQNQKNRDQRLLVILNAKNCARYWDERKLQLLVNHMDKNHDRSISRSEFFEIFSNFTG